MAEQTDDFVASLKNVIRNELVDLNTALKGEVVNYNNGLATVKPLANKSFEDGDSLPFPNLIRVPIRWPSFNGGLCGIKGPVKSGDEVLIIFSQQAIDGSDDLRRHDLSDAYAIPSGSKQNGQGSNNSDMIMWFGDAYIKLTSNGKLEINAPGGSKIITPNNEFTGNNKVDGTQTITGLTSMNGGFNSNGIATNDGKSIGDDHKHSGVQPGAGQTGTVV